MWRFPDNQLVIKRANEMDIGQFFLYYDEADTAQLAVVATHAMEPDSRYCLRLTGDKAFQVIATDHFERHPDYYFQLPLKLQDTELVLKTNAVRTTNNSAIGRLSAPKSRGNVHTGGI